ncbi:MAG: hypothetical protein NTW05_11770 [Pseudonocardiales bacterium]|nr:hypothetical protein [Pseudonocardiales bacterium]
MPITRRDALVLGAASGALLLAGGAAASAQESPSRASRVVPGSGERLLQADLHNHTLLSDGAGRAEDAFASMRDAGLDVAAVTDHAAVGKLQGDLCQGCAGAVGIDESEWRRIGALADAANEGGAFVAMRGFEWSSPTLGHVNVWGSRTWTDPLATGGIGAATTAAALVHAGGDPLPGPVATLVDRLLRRSPENRASMAGFYEWLRASPDRPLTGGGADALAGFNHPGREAGRFGFFTYDPRLADRIVSLEMFNRGEDYLFEQTDAGAPSPLVECLDAGWRVGLLGVTDEHGTDWGVRDGLGRTGLWARSTDRAGVREAMARRRFFATRERALRLDASANGVPMGGRVDHDRGDLALVLDVDGGTEWLGRTVRVQVLQTGRPMPTVVDERDVVLADAPLELTVPIDRADGGWVVLRVTDPALPADPRATGPYAAAGSALAYASPFFLGAPTAPTGLGGLVTSLLGGRTFGLRASAHRH